MPPCPTCQQPASKRNGRDRRSREKYACRPCRRTFTENTVSAFSGYRWPVDVILMAVRCYLAYPLFSRQVVERLAERGIDVSPRTVLNWVQTFPPQLAAEVRRRRRPCQPPSAPDTSGRGCIGPSGSRPKLSNAATCPCATGCAAAAE